MATQRWQRSNDSAAMAEKVAALQRQWRRSDGDGGAAMATGAQRWRRGRSDGLGSAATAMTMAVHRWGWQWWWRLSNGGVANDGCGAAIVVGR
jgi:hypothetical protein